MLFFLQAHVLSISLIPFGKSLSYIAVKTLLSTILLCLLQIFSFYFSPSGPLITWLYFMGLRSNKGNYITSYHNIEKLQSRLSNNSHFGTAVFKTSKRFLGQTEGRKVLASRGSIDSRSVTGWNCSCHRWWWEHPTVQVSYLWSLICCPSLFLPLLCRGKVLLHG